MSLILVSVTLKVISGNRLERRLELLWLFLDVLEICGIIADLWVGKMPKGR